MKLVGTPFINSGTCRGEAFTPDAAPLDFAEIMISGRYPENGWAKNSKSHEIVRVLQGEGALTFRGQDEASLRIGDVVHVPPGKQFAWSGDMVILMACSPAFDPEQYEIEEEN